MNWDYYQANTPFVVKKEIGVEVVGTGEKLRILAGMIIAKVDPPKVYMETTNGDLLWKFKYDDKEVYLRTFELTRCKHI